VARAGQKLSVLVLPHFFSPFFNDTAQRITPSLDLNSEINWIDSIKISGLSSYILKALCLTVASTLLFPINPLIFIFDSASFLW
jgi:hypothetical protein